MSSSNLNKLKSLLKKIHELAGDGPEDNVCVDALEFLDGNEDPGSIGCNLEDHPGLDKFRSVVGAARKRPEVSAILARISEVMGEEDFPFTDTLLVCTSAPARQVASWFKDLSPDEVFPAETDELVGLPKAPAGHKWHSVWWD